MKHKLLMYTPLIVLIVLIIIFAFGLTHQRASYSAPMVGQTMPTFNLPAFHQPHNELTTEAQQIIVLHVFASWCKVCAKEMPLLYQVRQPKLRFVGLAYKESRHTTMHWLKQVGNPFDTIYFDIQGDQSMDLGVVAVPETYLIDKQGYIRGKWLGALTKARWQNEVLSLIKGLQ